MRMKMKTVLIILAIETIVANTQIYFEYDNLEYSEKPIPVVGFEASKILFASDIYKQLNKIEQSNFLFCPLSLQVLLALAHVGAGGNTAHELAEGIRLPDNPNKIKNAVQELILKVSKPYKLTSVNKIYLANDFKINEYFKNIAISIYNSDIENIDFNYKEEAADKINQWVKEKTNNTITDFINDKDFDKSTLSVIANAMYFNANWMYQFDPNLTKPTTFYIDDVRQVEIDMLYKKMPVNTYVNELLGAKYLELPYEGGEVSMTIILPKEKGQLKMLQDNIELILVKPPYKKLKSLTHIWIPKFQMKYSIDLKPLLTKLGIKEAFTAAANFSGITNNRNQLSITHAIQKTFIKVTESGTNAGSLTGVVAGERGLTKFVVNHPFIYIIRHRKNGILFVGRYTNPIGTEVN
ncbi:hypothetical protein RN001_005038 [Aquatica leii]|uniref:Serpin domain-containing protein n=1 Tax=Aquatica leii TaxID=1421715 RepID=A0AAN7PZD9_9COLE|nr:hypothetical protein RN001_005038 [Aquatica leii]